MCNCMGLHEFGRLVGDCRAVGNLSPLVSPVCPNLDLRTKLDDFHNIKLSEWKGYYPGSIRSGFETQFDKKQIENFAQLFKSESEFKRLAEIEKIKKLEAKFLI